MNFKEFFKEEKEKREEKRRHLRKLDIEYECQIANDTVFKRLEDKIKEVIQEHFLAFEERPTIVISKIKLETSKKHIFHTASDYLETDYQPDHSIAITGRIYINCELTEEENRLVQDGFRKAVIQALEADNKVMINPSTDFIMIDIESKKE